MDESLEKIVQEAGTAYSEGRFEDAKNLYESAILSNENNGILHANLSAILVKLKNPQKSLEHSKKAVELCPNWPKAYYRLGEAYRHIKGKEIDAILQYCNGLKLDSSNFQILRSLEDVINQKFTGKFPWKQLEILKIDKSAAILLSTIGQFLLETRDFQEAERILEISVEIFENQKNVFPIKNNGKLQKSIIESLATAYCGNLKYEKAIGCYLRLLALFEHNDLQETQKIREKLAGIAENCDDFLQLAAVQRTFRIDSGSLKNDEIFAENLKIAEIYLKMAKPDDAISILEKEKCKCGASYQDLGAKREELLGVALTQKLEFKNALKILIPVSRNVKNLNFQLIDTINRCFIELDDLNSSIEFLNKILKDLEKNQDQDLGLGLDLTLHIYSLLCQTQIAAANLEIALKIAKNVLRIAKNCNLYHESKAYRLLAMIYEHQKDGGSAIVLWKKYLEFEEILQNMEIIQAQIELGKLAEDSGNSENPENFYENAVKIAKKPEEIAISNSAKFRFLLKNRRFSDAQKCLEITKNLLETAQFLAPKFKSLILEDVAGLEAENREKFRILEASLTEAQDDGDLYREAMVLERIARMLETQGKIRSAEKYYNQQLEVGRELRNAKLMGESHANIARLKFAAANFAAASEHARSSLTIAKLTKENALKIEMLILLAKAESKANFGAKSGEISMSAIEKAIGLAEECEELVWLAKAYRISADIFKTFGKEKEMILEMVQNHIELFEHEKSARSKFQSLIDFLEFSSSTSHEPQNLLKMIEEMAENERDVEMSQILEVIRIFEQRGNLDMKLRFTRILVDRFGED